MPVTIQEKLSWVPLRIQILFNDTELAIGTAFFYECEEETYLVTNWHNVTGRSPNDLKLISNDAAIPNKLIIPVPMNKKIEGSLSDGVFVVKWKSFEIELYNDGIPIWYEHPEHKNNVDAVVLPISLGGDTKAIAANDREELDLEDIVLRPSIDAFVLGYPVGVSGGAKFPIWKRASIASEPDIDIDNLPKYLIDTATREGMSGSPVFAQINGYFIPEGKSGMKDGVFGEGRRFAGVYSGRVGKDNLKAQLGIVWKEQALVEIIEAKQVGVSSFEI